MRIDGKGVRYWIFGRLDSMVVFGHPNENFIISDCGIKISKIELRISKYRILNSSHNIDATDSFKNAQNRPQEIDLKAPLTSQRHHPPISLAKFYQQSKRLYCLLQAIVILMLS